MRRCPSCGNNFNGTKCRNCGYSVERSFNKRQKQIKRASKEKRRRDRFANSI